MDSFSWDVLVEMVGLAVAAGTVIARLAAMEKKVERLETKVDQHNHFDARLCQAECKNEFLEQEIKEIRRCVDELDGSATL